MPILLAAAALAAQQVPIPPGGLLGARLRVGEEAIRCIQQQVPALERLVARADARSMLEQTGSVSPELEELLATVGRCLSALPPADYDPALFARRYLTLKAAFLASGRYLEAAGISSERLRRFGSSRQLIWLSMEPGAPTASMADLDGLFRRFRIAPDQRDRVIAYVVLQLFVSLTETTMRPPPQRAEYIGGTIEVGDYPGEAVRARLDGAGSILFEVLPDGSIGRCLTVHTTGSPAFGRASCRAVSRRHRYAPARNAAGRPTIDVVNATIHRRLPG